MMPAPLALALLAAAFWESWRWLAQRTWWSPEDAVILVATAGLVLGLAARRIASGRGLAPLPALPLAAAVLAHVALVRLAPPLAAASLAVTTSLAAVWIATHDERPPPAFWGLCLLIMPVLPTLQFFLGYPMRLVSAALTVPLLQLNGIAVTRSGVTLEWRGETILFDAPCSGVTMLWAGLLLLFVVTTIQHASWSELARATFLALRLLLAANVLRAASLFYLETGALPLDATRLHEAVGLAAYGAALLILVIMLQRLRRPEPC